ncbi:MAG: anhydro-N-acetylmuramic acid kinase [Alphaproteobacteria bacterium]|nr:MAG: anhydro-N-acetylmuramic acid kinase [Alphaproteobacteria bacterium]
MEKSFTALGLMSGTSMDGVDAAILRTDGRRIMGRGGELQLAYDAHMRGALKMAITGAHSLTKQDLPPAVARLEEALTDAHIVAVERLLESEGLRPRDIDFIGFHGQTLLYDPARHRCIQLGDSQRMADRTGIEVVSDFRAADLAHGGEGAPLVPLYHAALLGESGITAPAAIVNIGGVANITFCSGDKILAFDTGPGNALIDDWVATHTGHPYDSYGALGLVGEVNEKMVAALMSNDYFDRPPPKALDRNAFSAERLAPLSIEDGAATLAAFTAEAIARAQSFLPEEARGWVVCGGGRHNATIMRELEMRVPGAVQTAEEIGWRGDALEAEAFAFLAVRSFLGLPLSLPTTTGVAAAQTGGRHYSPTS